MFQRGDGSAALATTGRARGTRCALYRTRVAKSCVLATCVGSATHGALPAGAVPARGWGTPAIPTTPTAYRPHCAPCRPGLTTQPACHRDSGALHNPVNGQAALRFADWRYQLKRMVSDSPKSNNCFGISEESGAGGCAATRSRCAASRCKICKRPMDRSCA